MRRGVSVLTFAGLALAACSTGHTAPSTTAELTASTTNSVPLSVDTTVADSAQAPPGTDGNNEQLLASRPFEVLVPDTYEGSTAMPLVMLLHGFSLTGTMQDDFFHFGKLADSRGFLMVAPDGTRNEDNKPFWDATDACCGFGATVDDSAYLAAVIKSVQADYAVDPQRIFIIGFSNGGFMAHRMACDHSDLVASFVSISAATFLDPMRCSPTTPVNVVEIHGTDDETIAYDGGSFEGTAHPSAEQTVAQWAQHNECSSELIATNAGLDLDRSLAGHETMVSLYEGCAAGGAVELWTIVGGGHVPDLSTSFTNLVIDFLFAHPKPTA